MYAPLLNWKEMRILKNITNLYIMLFDWDHFAVRIIFVQPQENLYTWMIYLPWLSFGCYSQLTPQFNMLVMAIVPNKIRS